jgi:hypothetical protein
MIALRRGIFPCSRREPPALRWKGCLSKTYVVSHQEDTFLGLFLLEMSAELGWLLEGSFSLIRSRGEIPQTAAVFLRDSTVTG